MSAAGRPLWRVLTLPTSGVRSDDANVFELDRAALDALPFGVITLDRSGTILRFNREQEALSRRESMRTVGLDFFSDVAPCANVQAFRGRFDAFALDHESGVERFAFSFAFRWGRQDVSITMLRKAGHAEINILVHGKSMGRADASPAAAQPDESTPLARRSDAGYPLLAEIREHGRPTVWQAGTDALRNRVHAEDLATVSAVVAAAAAERTAYAVEYRGPTSGSGRRIFVEHGFFAGDPSITSYATVVDVTEQREREAAVWRAGHYDHVTGLPNSQLLRLRIGDAIREAVANGRIAAVLIVNIGHFRDVNDVFGHESGNAVLRAVALRLGECVRGGDTVARIAADWFVVLLTDLESAQSARDTATRLVSAVAQPFMIAEHTYYLALRVGISLAPYDSLDPNRLLLAAEAALFAAKVAGHNGIRFYSNQLPIDAASGLTLQNELRSALENDEFELLYQPLVDIDLDRVVAAEALMRWNHPTRGVVSPLDFIPLADRTGLIVPLGEWVLRTACRQARAWHDAGFDVRVCVNVSTVQFQRPDFVDLVTSIVNECELPPGRLELELTESIMVDGFGEMMETLSRLKALGLRLAIDDFGTGYSSLSYLKYFPVDTLKIDRAFITDIVSDKFDHAIAAAIFRLAESLGLECVVEGVEDVEQLETLRRIGSTVVQGFYFCRPSRPAELASLLAAPVATRELFATVKS